MIVATLLTGAIISTSLQNPTDLPRSAIYLFEQAPTDGASEAAHEAATKLLVAGKLQVVKLDFEKSWSSFYPHDKFPKLRYKADEIFPEIPSAFNLLQVAAAEKLEYMCIIRCQYHAESKWVALGPKTKGYASVDVMLIDVANGELDISVKRLRSDSTKVESGLETVGSLLLSSGITMWSGGPKTPHLVRAVQTSLGFAFEDWVAARTKAKANRA
ncbi:MAG: hypothetical protein LCH41_00575 [Armatimonadetes bacterium]|nr:hypothetical protein [Armatimonadota bacterium]